MNDPRMILKEMLCSIGISSKDSTIIALEAGSSLIVVDKEYLKKYKYTNDIIQKASLLVGKFYMGKLFEY